MERKKITTNFPSTKEWEKQIKKWEGGEPIDIYARYDSPELRDREQKFTEMIGAADAAIFNSGMAAIVSAIEAEELKTGDVVLCGKGLYEKATEYLKDLKRRGIRVVEVDSGNMEEVEGRIKAERPRLIFFESVGNNIDMPVCNLEKLVQLAGETNEFYKEELNFENSLEKFFKVKGKEDIYEKIPNEQREKIIAAAEGYKKDGKIKNVRDLMENFGNYLGIDQKEARNEIRELMKYLLTRQRDKLSLVIDNTLPSPFLYNPLGDTNNSEVEMTVVESGTKHYQKGKDKITLGVVYSNDKDKVEKTRKVKATMGTYLQPVADREIPPDLAEAAPEILKRHAENALKLAERLESLGAKSIERVSHPNLPSHKNYGTSQKESSGGLSTLFYVKAKDEAAAKKIVDSVKELGGEKIGIGGSFGHEKTWLFYYKDQIRIAAGSESQEEFEKILDIFKKAVAG